MPSWWEGVRESWARAASGGKAGAIACLRAKQQPSPWPASRQNQSRPSRRSADSTASPPPAPWPPASRARTGPTFLATRDQSQTAMSPPTPPGAPPPETGSETGGTGTTTGTATPGATGVIPTAETPEPTTAGVTTTDSGHGGMVRLSSLCQLQRSHSRFSRLGVSQI